MTTPLITADGVRMKFGKHHVLDDVTFAIDSASSVGLVGENGAGKSTLLRILVGLLQPTSGRVTAHGRIGYCPQEPLVFDGLTVDENFRWFAAAHGLDDATWHASADMLVDRLAFAKDRHRVVAQLSGGTRQKLNLSLALLSKPDLLILDEPYSGFDWETYGRFWALAEELRAASRGILTVSHFMFDRYRFDRILVLRNGRLSLDEVTT